MTGTQNVEGNTVGFEPGAGGTSGQQQTPAPVSNGQGQPDWAAYIKTLDGLGDKITGALGEKLDGLTTTVKNSTPPPPAPKDPLEGIDLNALEPAQLFELIQERTGSMIQKAIDDALKPHAEHIVSLRNDLTTNQASTEITRLRAQHKDYEDWGKEMVDTLQAHPTLSLEQTYRLARSSNPTKSSELEAKYNPPAPRPPRPFSFGPGTAPGSKAEPPMDRETAGRKAYEEVNARHGGALDALVSHFNG